MSAVVHVNAAQLENLLAGAQPVLIDFAAQWCGPCNAMSPALEAFAQSRLGQMVVAKVDIDESPELAKRYRVRGVPTLVVASQGRTLAMKTGAMMKSQLDAFVDSALA